MKLKTNPLFIFKTDAGHGLCTYMYTERTVGHNIIGSKNVIYLKLLSKAFSEDNMITFHSKIFYIN